jgi:hypothetical protein
MRSAKIAFMILAVLLMLSQSFFAADSFITADTTTKGDWVGKYGTDGYFLFAGSKAGCNDKLPSYVKEFTYTDLFGAEPSYHQWWAGSASDTSGIHQANSFEDAMWKDETKTERFIPCIYNANGLILTIDVGSVESKVSIYSCDWGNDGRCVEVVAYDESENEIGRYDLTAFEHGTYLTATITGNVTFVYTFFDTLYLGSPSNAVISAVFFDGVSSEQSGAEAELVAVDEPTAVTDAPVTADTSADTAPAISPQTFDVMLMTVSGFIISLGAAITLRKR